MIDTPLGRLLKAAMTALLARGGAIREKPRRGRPKKRHAYPALKDGRARDGHSIAAYDASVRARLENREAPRVPRSPPKPRVRQPSSEPSR